jgi:hypothetical protein
MKHYELISVMFWPFKLPICSNLAPSVSLDRYVGSKIKFDQNVLKIVSSLSLNSVPTVLCVSYHLYNFFDIFNLFLSLNSVPFVYLSLSSF